ncbi:MAG: hypothetical protein AAF288_08565 [Planctomycetota bacterium]
MSDPAGPIPASPLPAQDSPLRIALRRGGMAARKNLGPGVALWAVGLAILWLYFETDSGPAAFGRLADVRNAAGLWYALVATALAGGVLPWVVLYLRPTTRHLATRGRLAFLALFWAERGVEVHFLYAGLAALVGHGNDAGTIATKIALDMGLYAALWAMPSTLLAYQCFERGAVRPVLRRALTRDWWRNENLPVFIANVSVWLPAVAMIYSLDLALQVPMQNLVLCFWSLMMVFLVPPMPRSASKAESPDPRTPAQPVAPAIRSR